MEEQWVGQGRPHRLPEFDKRFRQVITLFYQRKQF